MIQLYSERQIESYLGVGDGTLQRMRRQGEGPIYVSITKSKRLFLREDVEAFIKSRRRKPTEGVTPPWAQQK
jgi:hypothetical protein